MKKESLTFAVLGIFLAFTALLLTRCNSSADNKATVMAEKAEIMDTTIAIVNSDTSMLVEAVQEIKEPDIVPPTSTAPTVKTAIKKTPVASKPNSAKPAVNKPVATLPSIKPAVITPAPKIETKPVTIPATKTPKIKEAGFSLKSAKAVIKGSSSLHDWESKVTKMEGKGSFETKDEELVAIKNVEIKIAVKGIKSSEGKKMDNKTYDTFKSDKNPYIVYTFSNAVVKVSDSHNVSIEATGKLTMAGNTQPVSLSATGKELANGDLQLSVSKKIKMTDYNMEPPVMMLGTIKVGNEITVDFDIVLEKTK